MKNKKKITYLLAGLLAACVAGGCTKEADTSSYKDMTTEQIEDSLGTGATKTGKDTYKVYGGVVKLCDYKNMELRQYTYKMTDGYLKEKAESYMKENAYYDEITTDIESGDFLTCKLKVTAEGKTIEDYSGDERTVSVGESDFGDQFDSKLIGKKVGDKGSEQITYDSEYAAEALAGKNVTIEYEINKVERYIEPELTVENVKSIYGLDSIDDFYDYIRKAMENGYTDKTKSMYGSQIFTYLLENCDFKSYDTALLNRYVEETKESYEEYKDIIGVQTIDEVMERMNVTEDDIKSNNEKYIYEEMATYAIAAKEGITVSEEEVDNKVKELEEASGYESEDDFYADYSRHLIRYWLYYDKVIDLIVKNAKLDEIVQYDQDPFSSDQ